MKDPLWVIEFQDRGMQENKGLPAVRYVNPKNSIPSETLPHTKPLPPPHEPIAVPDMTGVPVEEVTEKFLSYLNEFFMEFIEYSKKTPTTEAEGDQYAKELYKNLESLQKWMEELKKITDNDDELSSQDPPEELK